MSRKTSYDLVDEAMALMLALDDSADDEGVISDEAWAEWEQQLSAWASGCNDKLLALRAARDRLAAEEALHRGQAQLHGKRARRAASAISRIKYLELKLMEVHRDTTGETSRRLSDGTSVALTSSKSVQILDAAEIPDELLRVKREPDKSRIGKALKRGEQVPGAQLVERAGLRWSS